MSHCVPAARKPVRFKFTPETRVGDVLAVLCVRGTAHDLSVDERSRRRGPSKTKCMSSARYEGAWPDNDEKTKHASLKSTRRWTGSQCNSGDGLADNDNY